ncbi:MAG: hypothetical protein OXE17_10055 [Chloroflexi bacterium]|nr:hypothetical protein [Chloroflexota bacterium]
MNNSTDQITQLRRWLLLMFLLAAVLAMLWRQVPPASSAFIENAATGCHDSQMLEEAPSACTSPALLPASMPEKQ